MKVVLRIFLTLLILPSYLLLLISSTVRFQLLNYSFLTSNFQKYNTYSQIPEILETSLKYEHADIDREEQESYEKLIQSFTPVLTQDIVETNLKVILAFLNGENNDPAFYFPAQKIGLGDMPFKSDRIPLSSLSPQAGEHINLAYGATQKMTLVWATILALFLLLLFAHLKIGLKGTGVVLIIVGLIGTIVSFIFKHILFQMSQEFQVTKEPSQVALGLLAKSILPEIANTWIYISLALVIIGVILLVARKYISKNKSV